MDRHTRKDLKTDKFAREVTHTFEILSEHRSEVVRYGVIAIAVIVLAAGIYFYRNHQAGVRENALAQAVRVDDATVGPNVQPTNLHFDTAEEKDKALVKAYSDMAAKYHGSQEGAIAALYLASRAADQGNLADAEKRYKDIVDSAPKPYAAMARLSLAQVYEGEGKNADAEKVLRDAIAHPEVTVSKAEASIALAQLLAKTKPDEARKILEPLRTENSAVSRAAVQALSELAQNTPATK